LPGIIARIVGQREICVTGTIGGHAHSADIELAFTVAADVQVGLKVAININHEAGDWSHFQGSLDDGVRPIAKGVVMTGKFCRLSGPVVASQCRLALRRIKLMPTDECHVVVENGLPRMELFVVPHRYRTIRENCGAITLRLRDSRRPMKLPVAHFGSSTLMKPANAWCRSNRCR